MAIKIAAYQGRSWLSKAIRILTYSKYSHIAVLFDTDFEVEVNGVIHNISAGSIIEAWSGGVRLKKSISDGHTPGTTVDIFALKTPANHDQEKKIARFLIGQLGKKYDYLNVVRFVPVVRAIFPKPANSVWNRSHVFCSELGMQAFWESGICLLERCSSWEIPPRDPPRSPLLFRERQKTTVFQ